MSDVMAFIMHYITSGECWKRYTLETPTELDGIMYDTVHVSICDSPCTASITYYYQNRIVRTDVRHDNGTHETLFGEGT